MLGEVLTKAAQAGLTTTALWFNGEAWMATAQIEGHMLQVAGPIIDPEIAMERALDLAVANVGNPEEMPWDGKPSGPVLTDDGY